MSDRFPVLAARLSEVVKMLTQLCSEKMSSVRIINSPTPVVELTRLRKSLGGPKILIKHDDYTGLGFGGNKLRKLEFLIAQAIHERADTIITMGAVQSNHCRQTAAVAAKFGFACDLLLTTREDMSDCANRNGNILVDKIYGANLHYTDLLDGIEEQLRELASELASRGRRPFVIPRGGSNCEGSFGYIRACEELHQQVDELALQAVIHSTGSGGTQAGLLVGMASTGLNIPVHGISCGASSIEVRGRVGGLIKEICAKLDFDDGKIGPINVNDDYIGPGYGQPDKRTIDAIMLVARVEGIMLDPVYTGKAMAGLIDLIRKEVYKPSDTILFLHTGGSPSLFGYEDVLSSHVNGSLF